MVYAISPNQLRYKLLHVLFTTHLDAVHRRRFEPRGKHRMWALNLSETEPSLKRSLNLNLLRRFILRDPCISFECSRQVNLNITKSEYLVSLKGLIEYSSDYLLFNVACQPKPIRLLPLCVPSLPNLQDGPRLCLNNSGKLSNQQVRWKNSPLLELVISKEFPSRFFGIYGTVHRGKHTNL